MKKSILAFLFIFGFVFVSKAQQIPENAIGLRLGGGNGYGAEATYQRGLSAKNRLEVDLGLRNSNKFNAFKAVGLYQWVWNIEGGFNWYAGVGAGLGSVNDKHHHRSDGFYALIAGDIGVEYIFDDVPIQLFLDFRPEFILANYDVYDTFGPDFAIGIRFTF